MRYLKYIFYGVFLFFIGNELIPLYNQLFHKDLKKGFKNSELGDTKVSVSYILQKDKKLTFSIPSGVESIRILNNIDIPKESVDREEVFHYSIAYEVLGKDDSILLSNIYNHHSRVVHFLDPKTNKRIFTRFYLEEELIPTSTRKFFINLKGMKDPQKVRFSLKTLDRDARGATIRSYYQVENPEHKLADMWKRLNNKTKERVARGNVYDHELLTWKEKKNLLSKSWKPFGPLGVRGKDYELNNIYTRVGIEDLEEIPLEFGRHLKPPQRFTFRLQEGKTYFIESSKDLKDSEVFINHYDDNKTVQNYSFIQKDEDKTIGDFSGGLLEVFANESVFINLFESGGEELLPSRVYKNSLLIDKTSSATFKINHVQNLPTPLRISLRGIGEEKQGTLNLAIGEKTYSLKTNPQVSIYDSHNDRELPKSIGIEEIRYFDIPKDVEKVTITAQTPILANVAVAVATLPHRIIYSDDDIKSPPLWYSIKPMNKVKDLWSFKGIIPKEKTLNLRFSHKELDIVSNSRSRAVLIRKNREVPIKFYQYSSVYIPIENSQKIFGEFQSPEGVESVSSSLLYRREKIEDSFISVYVDNALIFHGKVSNKEGVIPLPKIKTRGKSVEVRSNKETKFWLSGFIENGKKDLFMKRYVYNLERPTTFRVVKKDNSPLTLSFKIYREGKTEKTTIEGTLKNIKKRGVGEFLNYTFKTKVYDIHRREESESFPVLNTPISVVEGRTIFFTLGDDIPAGEYLLEFKKLDTNLCYIYGYEGLEDYRDDFYLFKESL